MTALPYKKIQIKNLRKTTQKVAKEYSIMISDNPGHRFMKG